MGMMIVGLFVISLIFFVVNELITLSVFGFPPKDEDVLEFVVKVRNSKPYIIDGVKPGCILGSSGNPYISKTVSSCLFGGYISNVGVIPRWYESYGEINKLYDDLGVKTTKRERLGL